MMFYFKNKTPCHHDIRVIELATQMQQEKLLKNLEDLFITTQFLLMFLSFSSVNKFDMDDN